MGDFVLPTAFYFTVMIADADASGAEAAFQEVAGLESEMTVEELTEGGENTFVHRLPKGVKQPNLTLKRGLTDIDNRLVKWCKDTLEGGIGREIEVNELTVSLLDAEKSPVATWSLTNAWPVKWSVGNLDAMKNEIAFESIDLAYSVIRRTV